MKMMFNTDTWGYLETNLGSYLWIFGLLMAVALTITVVLVFDLEFEHFLAFMLIFIAFMVWGAILEPWIFIVMFIIFIAYFVYKHKYQGGN